MLSEQAEKWVREGRRQVDIAISTQANGVRTTIWAYDFDISYGAFIDADDPHWPTSKELAEARMTNLKRQIEEAAA